MSFNHGDLVKLRLMDDGGPWDARYADWRGRITDAVKRWAKEHGIGQGGAADLRARHVTPPIPYLGPRIVGAEVVTGENVEGIVAPDVHSRNARGEAAQCWLEAWSPDGPIRDIDGFRRRVRSAFALVEPRCAGAHRGFTLIPVDFLAPARRLRPKNAAKAPRKKPGSRKRRQETREAIELQKDDEDDAWFLDARAGDEDDDDADFHDAADTREKTLSAAVQSDLAQARSKRKGGRGRRRRRKRTRRTRRRKKRRTRRRRRKRTRRRRRR